MPDVLNVGFGTPFEEQIAFLRAKLRVPTERWDDIQESAHDRAFMVAGVAKADLLADLHKAVIDRATDGAGLQAFRRDFKAIVAKHGWTGWTGEGTPEGFAWRTKVIYQTNMAMSYAAGRYKQLTAPATLAALPWWRYLHSDSVMHPRPWHLAWHGLTLRNTDPFWQTHFAPNGFGCECRITAVTEAEGLRSLKAGLGVPPPGSLAIDPKTGSPVGVDKGFGYAPGAATDTSLRQMVQDKLITYPPAITRVLTNDVNRYINAEEKASKFAARVLQDKKVTETAWLGFVENADLVSQAAGQDVTGYTVLLPAGIPRHVERSHGNDGGDQRPPRPEDFDQVADVLNAADELQAGNANRDGMPTVVARKTIGGEVFRAVFEVLPGARNRALSLLSLVIKVVGQ